VRRGGTVRRSVGLGVKKVTGVYNKNGTTRAQANGKEGKRGNTVKGTRKAANMMKRKYTDNIVSRKKPASTQCQLGN
jgi:hypothetical protein